MDLGLAGKAGIVTGAGRGIGAAIARELGREKCAVALAARSLNDLETQAAEIARLGGQARPCPFDLQLPDTPAALVEATLRAFGRLDFVVANAGIAKMGDFLALTDEDWHEGFALKFFGHMRLIRAAWPHLAASKGAIVIIAGAAGRTPQPTSVITGAVNAALMNLTKSLAARGVSEGVRINVINPGAVRTGRFAERAEKRAHAKGVSAAEAEKQLVAEGGLLRIGEPEDIAGMVAYLLSARAGYIQGSVFDLDGGKTKTL